MGDYQTFNSIFDRTITRLRTFTDKPLVITETGATDVSGLMAQWITAMFKELPSHANIIGVIWYEDFDVIDWKVTDDPAAAAAFRKGFASARYRFTWSPDMVPLLKVPRPGAPPGPSGSSTSSVWITLAPSQIVTKSRPTESSGQPPSPSRHGRGHHRADSCLRVRRDRSIPRCASFFLPDRGQRDVGAMAPCAVPAGAAQPGQRRAAIVGLVATWLSVLAYVRHDRQPDGRHPPWPAPGRPDRELESAVARPAAATLASQWLWFAGGLIIGPVYGWLGYRWRARRSSAAALLAVLPPLLEPAARWLVARFGPAFQLAYLPVAQ